MLDRGLVEVDPAEPGGLGKTAAKTVDQRQGLPLLGGARGRQGERLKHRDRGRAIAAQGQRQCEVDRQRRIVGGLLQTLIIIGLGLLMASLDVFDDTEKDQQLGVVRVQRRGAAERRQRQFRTASLEICPRQPLQGGPIFTIAGQR